MGFLFLYDFVSKAVTAWGRGEGKKIVHEKKVTQQVTSDIKRIMKGWSFK